MAERHNLFVIHGWDDAHRYHRIVELVRDRESGLADYSVPPWKALAGTSEDIAAGITDRLRAASCVVVVNGPGLHKRPWSAFEMDKAVEMGKRIVVVQPHGEFGTPIPAALDGAFYRVAPWRSDVLGRAIRGEYPHDTRVFDIAEVADRRALVVALAAGVGFVSFVVSGVTLVHLAALQDEMQRQGSSLSWAPGDTTRVLTHALAGAAILGGIVALVTNDAESTVAAAAAGAALGGSVGLARVYAAKLHGTGTIRTLSLIPS